MRNRPNKAKQVLGILDHKNMVWNRTGKLFSLGLGGMLLLFSFGGSSLHAENSSISQAWKSCQSQDAYQRLVGCTSIINKNGGGSRSRLSDALDGRCWAYHVKGQYVLAIADCKASIAIRPDYSYSYNNLGTAYLGIGDFANAIIVLSKAIDLKPNFLWSRLNRAKAYVAIGEKEEAVRDFQSALAIEPQNDEATEALRALLTSDGTTSSPADANNPKPVTTQGVPQFPVSPANPVTQSGSGLADRIPSTSAYPLVPRASSEFGRRIALVIGNATYKNAPRLSNPQRDAILVADALKRTGFQSVTLQIDLGRDALVIALRNFAQQAETADWSVVYYSGHGMEVGGVNYLIPVDARIATDRDIGFEAVALDQVLNAAERAKRLRLVILDACRDNPIASQMKRTLTVASRSVSRGLASVEPDAGTLVVYAAKDGETALDGEGFNSPFAEAFVKNLQTPGLEVRRMFDFVRDDVMEATQRRQKPFSYGSISGRQDFYFVAGK
jgi:tetratricopeptide (TPR) repeat protein